MIYGQNLAKHNMNIYVDEDDNDDDYADDEDDIYDNETDDPI